jgi:hypothetical protein
MKLLLSYSTAKLFLMALLPAAILEARSRAAHEDDPLLPFPGVWDRRH